MKIVMFMTGIITTLTGVIMSTTGSTLVLILSGGLATTLGAVIALTLIINMGEWR